jgi:preprotein translocase subunit SecD
VIRAVIAFPALLVLATAALAEDCRARLEILGWPGGEFLGRALTAQDFEGGPVIVTEADIVAAEPSRDMNGGPAVTFRLDAAGRQAFGDYTAAHVGEPVAVFYEGRLLTAPIVLSAITGGVAIITGAQTVEESAAMAASLTQGAACPPAGS